MDVKYLTFKDLPITKVSDDVNNLEVLTPNHIHLLKGKPIFYQETMETSSVPVRSPLEKWTRPRRGFVAWDIVFVLDPTAPSGSWIIGRVTKTYPYKKGLVRAVQLKTKTGQLERPISKIFLLHEAVQWSLPNIGSQVGNTCQRKESGISVLASKKLDLLLHPAEWLSKISNFTLDCLQMNDILISYPNEMTNVA